MRQTYPAHTHETCTEEGFGSSYSGTSFAARKSIGEEGDGHCYPEGVEGHLSKSSWCQCHSKNKTIKVKWSGQWALCQIQCLIDKARNVTLESSPKMIMSSR